MGLREFVKSIGEMPALGSSRICRQIGGLQRHRGERRSNRPKYPAGKNRQFLRPRRWIDSD